MSDPVKSSEIEDVLSSIRRLVSEEARHEMQARRAEAEPAAPPETPAGREPDALVLTPALRVHDGGRASAAETQSAVAEALQEPASEGGVPEAPAADAPETEAEPAELSVTVAEVPEAPFEAAEEVAPDTLEAKITALEALIAGASEEADRAVPQSGTALPEPVEPETAEDATDLAEIAPPAETAEALRRDDAPEVDAPTEAGAPEPAAVQVAQDAPPEEAAEAAAAPVQPAAERGPVKPPQVEAPVRDAAFDAFEFTSSARRPVAVTPLAEDGPAGGLLDEDSLRDMVVEIVREELQGALGERITRNVRRLVRREIHRALAAQDLD